MINWKQVDDEALRKEWEKRQLESPTSPDFVATEDLLKALQTRFINICICFYPNDPEKTGYRTRVLYNGDRSKLYYLLHATAHDLMMDDGMIHSDRDKDPNPGNGL